MAANVMADLKRALSRGDTSALRLGTVPKPPERRGHRRTVSIMRGARERANVTARENRAPPGIEYTTDFGTYADPAQASYWAYRFMEATGISTF